MKKQIYIDRTEKTRICKEFKVSNVTLWSALVFKTDSGKARMLRKVALERGGKLVGIGVKDEPPIKANPVCETTFETSEGTMTQFISDRVKIVVYLQQNLTVVMVDDEPRIKEKDLSIPQFMNLQHQACKTASELK